MDKEIIKIDFKDTFGNPQSVNIDNEHTNNISQHAAQGEGDKWFWDVEYDNGETMRLFDVHTVIYKEANQK